MFAFDPSNNTIVENKMRNTAAFILTCYGALPVTAQIIENMEYGPRPYYLIDQMRDGVWLQSLNLEDVVYWIEAEPELGAQAVYLMDE
jgi:hypothetical protein